MIKDKYEFIIIFIFFLITLIISLIIIFPMPSIRRQTSGSERQEAMIDSRLIEFVSFSGMFEVHMVIDGLEGDSIASMMVFNMAHPSGHRFDDSYTELIFVHNREAAYGFPDNVIIAWPTERPWIHSIMARFNHYVSLTEQELPRPGTHGGRQPINLNDFGLSYPITIKNLVDNWESVFAVWNALTENERQGIWP